MNLKFTLLLFILLYSICSFGQDLTKEFKIQNSQVKISYSKYNTIYFVDSRIDTTNMGIVQVGLMNNQARVVSEIPFSLQLNKFLNSAIDSTAQNGAILFQLRQILFAETTAMASEMGYFCIRANLFAKNLNSYVKLASLDTIILVKAWDVTNLLMKTASDIITNCISGNLKLTAMGTELYTYNDILRIDSIEKRRIKVYNVTGFTDGLYNSYESFKNQLPDKEIVVERRRDLSIKKVMIKDNNSRFIKVANDEFYAFVSEGKPYISTGYGYYPLYYGNDNFYFIGNVKPMTSNNNRVATATIMFGLIGAIIASSTKGPGESYFTLIDHINGGFIQIRKMPTKSN